MQQQSVIPGQGFVAHLAHSRTYWAFVLVTAVGAEAVALWYQHGLGEQPCVLCIHVRLWVLAFALLAAVAMLLPSNRIPRIACHSIATLFSVGLLERAWQVWATENMLTEGSCSPFLGMPAWFSVDRWLPSVFEPRGLCGYTPEMLFGFTMADVLLAGAAAALVLTGAMLAAALFLHSSWQAPQE